jgi:hypothetical protein
MSRSEALLLLLVLVSLSLGVQLLGHRRLVDLLFARCTLHRALYSYPVLDERIVFVRLLIEVLLESEFSGTLSGKRKQ